MTIIVRIIAALFIAQALSDAAEAYQSKEEVERDTDYAYCMTHGHAKGSWLRMSTPVPPVAKCNGYETCEHVVHRLCVYVAGQKEKWRKTK